MNPLQAFVSKFTERSITEIDAAKQLDNKFVLLSEQLSGIIQRVGKKVFIAGLLLGETRPNRFLPSSSLIDIIAKHTNRKVVVNRKTSWLFVCGRDVFGEGIVQLTADSGHVIVENELGEALGYGEMISKPEKSKVAVKNLFDKGAFLRRERKRKL